MIRMGSSSTIQNVLGELLKVNRERVAGYKKASQNTDDPGLKAMFLNMADQGQKNITDISKAIVDQNGNTRSAKASHAEKIYGALATFKTKFSDKSIKNVLTSCESMETAAMNIYEKARDKALDVQLAKLIEKHEMSFRSSQEVIRVYRKAYLNLDKMYS